MDQYRNNDGTYTSPKNGKLYKSLKAFTAHWHYAGTTSPTAFANRLRSMNCKFCNKSILQCSIKKHETAKKEKAKQQREKYRNERKALYEKLKKEFEK